MVLHRSNDLPPNDSRNSAAILSVLFAAAASGSALAGPAVAPQGQSMRIESCNLGCSSGAGGSQVSCTLTTISMNRELRVRFTRAVDPASLSSITFGIIDVGSGQTPTGTRFVDPGDPNVAVFRPSFSIDGAGNPVFGFEPFTTYRITLPGASQGDPPPYIQSADALNLPNRSRMQCDVMVSGTFDSPGTPFCAGDGIDPAVTTPCPCANLGASGRGCANSAPAGNGGLLFALGSTSPDEVALFSTSAPSTALTLFFQGNQSIPTGVVFGDGIRCVSGTLVRLGAHAATSGIATYPSQSDLPITEQSAARGDPIAPGSTREYQAWYREGDPAFCANPPGDDWNVTNGVRIAW